MGLPIDLIVGEAFFGPQLWGAIFIGPTFKEKELTDATLVPSHESTLSSHVILNNPGIYENNTHL